MVKHFEKNKSPSLIEEKRNPSSAKYGEIIKTETELKDWFYEFIVAEKINSFIFFFFEMEKLFLYD